MRRHQERVTAVRVVCPYVLAVTPDNHEPVSVDVEAELYGEIFEPLLNPEFFAAGTFDPTVSTIV